MALYFNTPDFSKCTRKKMCCNGGSNHGLVYEVDKPCIDGYKFNSETCKCEEVCMSAWLYKFTVSAELVGLFAYNPNGTLCSPFGLAGAEGPINSNERGKTRTIYGRTPIVELGRADRDFGACVSSSNCPGCVRANQPSSGQITSLRLGPGEVCGIGGGGGHAWAQSVPFLPYVLNSGNPHAHWEWSVDKIQVQNPNTNQYVDLPGGQFPLPDDYEWPES